MKRYSVIYADPPWTFKTYSENGKLKKAPELHYECMDIQAIYDLPVGNIAEKDCVLFLWVTNPMLKQGLICIKRWGFEYKTVAFSWFKRNKVADSFFFGLGYWTRQNTEHCLLATRGKPTRVDRGVPQVVDFELLDTEQIDARIMEHSRKPPEVRDRIVRLCGDVTRVELFARERVKGWDSIGYEIDGRDIVETISETHPSKSIRSREEY